MPQPFCNFTIQVVTDDMIWKSECKGDQARSLSPAEFLASLEKQYLIAKSLIETGKYPLPPANTEAVP